jgi:bifunctional UDP-N-acetylglucosamine pyrophosphorylase / glucosamine-1-phosphate N-acetyltransferase
MRDARTIVFRYRQSHMTHAMFASRAFEKTTAIVLAAGQGTRMKSTTPKVLHTIAGRPLVHYPVRSAIDAGCDEIVVVVGHGRVEVEAYLKKAFGERVKIALQEEPRGTGDAARAGLARIGSDAMRVLVFYGDAPLLMGDDVAAVVRGLVDVENAALSLAICELADPTGYGRILRGADGNVIEVREQKDCKNDNERAIREINPGIYASSVAFMREALRALTPNNAQGELYLTDIVSFAANLGKKVVAVPSRAEVLVGVNDRAQLADAEVTMAERIVRRHRIAGATVRVGARIDDEVEIASDALVETSAVLRGATRIGRGAIVDVGCVLTNADVGEGVRLKPYSVVTDSKVGARAEVGPFSHLRPESVLEEDAHIGNFVETKKTHMGKGAKANHLAYLGDSVVGDGANIGAGTIFCNYDGFQKHTTVIGRNAFIGSDSQLVAPVTIGDGAYVATGTTITRDVPADALAIGRAKQENKEGYGPRLRAQLKAAKDAARGKHGPTEK